ncbi:MAG: hypothetical protein HOP31_02025, partial [Ignavibacteria bacterium]|nr:hypothetical protein [Ignavibacteria bacterium]
HYIGSVFDKKYEKQLQECYNEGKGFIHLSWNLVNALRKHGFGWGATFLNPDFMHFEYPIWKLYN